MAKLARKHNYLIVLYHGKCVSCFFYVVLLVFLFDTRFNERKLAELPAEKRFLWAGQPFYKAGFVFKARDTPFIEVCLRRVEQHPLYSPTLCRNDLPLK